MTIDFGILTAHVPSICDLEQAPDYQQVLVDGMKQVSEKMFRTKPEAVVLVSCHWQSTFFHYVDATPKHEGLLTATECPDLVSHVPYRYSGDEKLANDLIQAGKDAGIPVLPVNDPAYIWDYGTLVLLRHLVPQEDLPVVELSVSLAASLEETYEWGRQIGKVLRENHKRIVFVASGALSHHLVRGRENKPTRSEQALNDQFVQYLMNAEISSALEMLPQYAKIAGVEAGGRHLAVLLGVLEDEYEAVFYGAAQSSGSWNPVLSFELK